MGWATLKNGELLDNAQIEFDVLLTTDQNMKYQQNLSGRSIAVVVLIAPNNRLETLRSLAPEVATRLPHVHPGELAEVET